MRVLVVEDEPDMRALLARSLQEQGYAVDAAANGREGLLKAVALQYDALILDLMLPLMDGLTVLTELRREGYLVPVLLLTARDAVRDRVTGLDLGADDYLAKPFELAELMARLRALTRRAAGKASAVIEIGDIRVEMTSQKVFRSGGKEVGGRTAPLWRARGSCAWSRCRLRSARLLQGRSRASPTSCFPELSLRSIPSSRSS